MSLPAKKNGIAKIWRTRAERVEVVCSSASQSHPIRREFPFLNLQPRIIMKFSTCLSAAILSNTLFASVQANPSNLQRRLQGGKDKGGSKGGSKGGGNQCTATTQIFTDLLDGQCFVCTPDNKNKPSTLTVKYMGGGTGAISRYQDECKATCRDQNFPDTATITAYGKTYDVSAGSVITFEGDNGSMDAETDFYFDNGDVSECFIHTSCSQPIVTGDQIGPFLILEGPGCKYCGEGAVEAGESCESIITEIAIPDNVGKDDKKKDDKKPQNGTPENEVYTTLLDGQCAVCTPDNKQKPTTLTVKYMGGPGVLSRFQDEFKATCRDQVFPDSAIITAYGIPYNVTNGTLITFVGDNGNMDAETDFYFDRGEVSECFIHTSCSQAIVTGDQIGPFLIVEGPGCVYEYCGDGMVNGDEDCDPGEEFLPTDTCRSDCTEPRCGDNIVDPGEECDEGVDMPSASCRECKIPYCGDGIVDDMLGEECDDGMNGVDTDGCRDDCSFCACEASASYDMTTGAVTIDYDMCGTDPDSWDWIGIYPCDASTMVADQGWWEDTFCRFANSECPEAFTKHNYTEGQVYVNQEPLWLSYTCGNPQDGGCQTDFNYEWPVTGVVTIDPSTNGADFAFPGGSRTLEPGCYKVVMNRDTVALSPPPYPTICAPWVDALEFTVPEPTDAPTPVPTAAPTAAPSNPESSPVESSAGSGFSNADTSVSASQTQGDSPQSSSSFVIKDVPSGSRRITTGVMCFVSFLAFFLS